MANKEYTLNFTGDVMLGRLIDQLYPTHVSSPNDERHVRGFQRNYTAESPWGTALPLLAAEGDLNFINLETSITTHPVPWPDKAFNYRMHPANAIPILSAANIDFACLANNHTLDFGTEGLVETVWTLKQHSAVHATAGRGDYYRVAFAGAGETTEEAFAPAILELPRKSQRNDSMTYGNRPSTLSAENLDSVTPKHLIHIYAASDHPYAWRDIPTFHFVDYSAKAREHLKRLIWKHSPPPLETRSTESSPALKIFSFHWGPNYSWHPAPEIRQMAHFLIFECGIDIVHGHSSHHVQGIECPAPGKLIIYGCGDFVDDYAVNKEYRNDLGALYRVIVQEQQEGGVRPARLEAHLLQHLAGGDGDHDWVVDTISRLTGELMGSECECGYGHEDMTGKNIVRPRLGDRGQLIVDLV
ncbi:polyglutamate biosynthesis protein, putative [Talaromyces marneffei ATCC 18224]|uniref:Polyglutamate biosynthesis protein, putative n=1 Tax=Talaromyces marneffei (strain ATCC 18224 / CBS 334.59 / QM 7333) TaxID=441960 RepID=B6Q5M3_TALMQ|nr:polyglutamate biosynthesis protein, putative [Talaromyces marneffei ATCC 18224]